MKSQFQFSASKIDCTKIRDGCQAGLPLLLWGEHQEQRHHQKDQVQKIGGRILHRKGPFRVAQRVDKKEQRRAQHDRSRNPSGLFVFHQESLLCADPPRPAGGSEPLFSIIPKGEGNGKI